MKLWITAAIVPALLWVSVLAWPALDQRWESHPAHFWLVRRRRASRRRRPAAHTE